MAHGLRPGAAGAKDSVVREMTFVAARWNAACYRPGMSSHAVIWLDQQQAKVFFFDRDTYDETSFHAPKHHMKAGGKLRETHHRGGELHEQKEYFESVAKTVADVEEILVLGPGTAKTQFLKHVHAREPKLEQRIVGVETADHPTAGQIVAHARAYFLAKDKMLGTAPL